MINKRQRFVDMIGKKCGRLSVVNFAYFKKYPSGSSVAYWDCLCDCGNKKIIDGRSLRNGTTKSCNCLMREIASKTHKNKPKSEEQKRKMSLAAMNQKHSEERRKKNSLSKMGYILVQKIPIGEEAHHVNLIFLISLFMSPRTFVKEIIIYAKYALNEKMN